MTYIYRDRLKNNSKRFNEINTETIDYFITETNEPIVGMKVSPILRRPDTYTEAPMEVDFDRQWFAIDVTELIVGKGSFFPRAFFPQTGDTITRADNSIYEVTAEDRDSPTYQFITSDRERVIVHTQRASF